MLAPALVLALGGPASAEDCTTCEVDISNSTGHGYYNPSTANGCDVPQSLVSLTTTSTNGTCWAPFGTCVTDDQCNWDITLTISFNCGNDVPLSDNDCSVTKKAPLLTLNCATGAVDGVLARRESSKSAPSGSSEVKVKLSLDMDCGTAWGIDVSLFCIPEVAGSPHQPGGPGSEHSALVYRWNRIFKCKCCS